MMADGTKPGGEGTQDSPYLIGTLDEMIWFHDNATYQDCVKLTNDIDLSGYCSEALNNSWTPIAWTSRYYDGHFDGDGHKISNLYVYDTDSRSGDGVGFFKYLGNCKIENLTFENANVTCYTCGGILSAYVISSAQADISNVTISGHVKGTSTSYGRVGGFIGANFYGKFTNCINEADVETPADHAGGFYSSNYGTGAPATMEGCINRGSISGNYYVGGLSGSPANLTLLNCLNTGTVTGYNYLGGFVGSISSNRIVIQNSLTTGDLIGTSVNKYIGHCIGYVDQGGLTITEYLIKDCFYAESAAMKYKNTEDLFNTDKLVGGISGRASPVAEVVSTSGCTDDQLSNGLVAFVLQGNQSSTKWGQILGTDNIPQPSSSDRVYVTGSVNCKNDVVGSFTNTATSGQMIGHQMSDGFCSVCDYCEQAPYIDGVYNISNTGQFYWFSKNETIWSFADAILVSDIDLALVCGEEKGSWAPIGTQDNAFAGTFNGQNHVISNLYIDTPNNDNCGLFGKINNKGVVQNLRMENVHVVGKNRVGGVCGQTDAGELANIYVGSGTVNGVYAVGGILGFFGPNNNAELINCENHADVTCSENSIGGVVGYVSLHTVKNCSNYGNIECTYKNSTLSRAGGIVGYTCESVISDCYNQGTVKVAADNCGGIVGFGENAVIQNCLSQGNIYCVKSVNNVGLVAGAEESVRNVITNCYASETAKIYQNGSPVTVDSPLCPNLQVGLGELTAKIATQKQLSSGEIAYALQHGRSELVWGQTLGTDAVPCLGGPRVYLEGTEDCQGYYASGTFNNTAGSAAASRNGHTYVDDICQKCGDAKAATLIDGVCQISKLSDFVWFRQQVNAGQTDLNAAQTADIDLSPICENGKSWVPVGLAVGYSGVYDGQDKSIKGLKITSFMNHSSLFYGLRGTVKNLKINGEINGNYYTSFVTGKLLSSGVIDNIETSGTITVPGADYVAGIVGFGQGGKISNCTNRANINGKTSVGGIAGYYYDNGIVTNCQNYGDIQASGYSVGGIVGYGSSSKCTNVANYGHISRSDKVGGIIGEIYSKCYLTNAYNSGNIESVNNSGRTSPISTYKSATYINCWHNSAKTVLANGTEIDHSEYSSNYSLATADDVSSGKLAYTLGSPFGQNLNVDDQPYLNHARVYYGNYKCGQTVPSGEVCCSNTPIFETETPHQFGNYSKCKICHKHSPTAIWSFTFDDWKSSNQGVSSSKDEKKYAITVNEGDHIVFDWTVDSEGNYDKFSALILYNNSTYAKLVNSVSGSTSGHVDYTFKEGGEYELYFFYTKDGSGDTGTDTATATNISIPGEACEIAKGDLTGNGVIDIEDLPMLIDVIRDEDNDPYQSGDINNDGKKDAQDVESLRNLLLNP